MPRLLLVARNPALAFGLASASDDILEVRPSLVGRLEVTPGMADVVVIEQENPEAALATLDLIRAAGLMAPALLVASSRPEWATFDAGSRPSVAVLDPPITPDRLGQSVGTASGLGQAQPPAAEPVIENAEDLPELTLTDESVVADDLLPEGPVDLEPQERPYATATHLLGPTPDGLEPGAVEREAEETDVGPSEIESAAAAALAEAAALAKAGSRSSRPRRGRRNRTREAETEALALAAAEATALAEAETEALALAAAEATALAEAETEALALAAAEATALAEAETEALALAAAEATALAEAETEALALAAAEATALAEAETEALALAAAEATASLSAELSLDETVVEQSELARTAPAESPAQETYPELLTEVPPRQPWSAGVYAAMASLVAASGERIAQDGPSDAQVDSEEAPLTAETGAQDQPNATVSPTVPRARTEARPSQPAAGPPDESPTQVVDLRVQPPWTPPPTDPQETSSLVRALLARGDEIYGVWEAGSLVVVDALARTGADAGALLLPDGDAWRVAAGEGLRRLELRYALAADSWLVTTIASRHKGIIIDRTDVARRPLAGAPLASHKHLLAAPVRAVQGILLIARDDDPGFDERDLLSVARLAEGSASILSAAIDARHLARLLGDIRDQDDAAATERLDYGL